MNASAGEKAIEALSRNILEARFEDIDQTTLDNTKLRILDTIGCAIGGARLPDIVALVRMVRRWGGKKEASILGYGSKVPSHNAAFVNCTMCRGFDRGPLAYLFKGKIVPNHISETTVLTALTLGESKGIDGKELITALLVGDDLAARLHLAKDHPLPGEYHTAGDSQPRRVPQPGIQTTAFGAAAIAGRLLSLDLQQMKNTLGLVGNSDSFAGGIWDGAPTFKIGQGTAASNGIVAAQLASAGWTGMLDPLFNERAGFFKGGCDHPELLSEELGKKFYVEVMFKPFPGGGPTQSPSAAGIAIVKKHHIQAEDIEEAVLRTSPGVATGLHYARPYKVGDYPTGDALFSYKYAVANSLARGSAANRDYAPDAVRDPRVQALIGKVRLALAELPKSEGVELEVKMKDGRRFTEYVARAQGDPDRPLAKQVLLDKFMEQVDYTQIVSRSKAKQLIKMIEQLEKVGDVRQIVNMAVKG